MDRRIAELNIEHFQKKLAEESDPRLRKSVQLLLLEEQPKLKEIMRQLTEAKKSG